jgi:organic radical activating enzyme
MELWLCNTCTFHCGYCTLAENGEVSNKAHLEIYKNKKNIEKIISFFDTYTTSEKKWTVIFTGGEPFLVPNLHVIIRSLIQQKNKVCFYTNLSIPLEHDNFSWLDYNVSEYIDYFMCTFHPEWIGKENLFFKRISELKSKGAKPIVRFVSHPEMLYLLSKLDHECRSIGVTFYPTTLFSKNYPRSYSQEEKSLLNKYMKGYSPLIQLEGGLDVSNMICNAGATLFAANIPNGGDITPCISVEKPVVGNIFKCKLKEFKSSTKCLKKEKVCTCDIHFQYAIIPDASDENNFELVKEGRGVSVGDSWEEWKQKNGLKTTNLFFAGQGGVKDDSKLIFKKSEEPSCKSLKSIKRIIDYSKKIFKNN